MKSKNRKRLSCVCLILAGVLLLISCGADASTKNNNDAPSQQNDPTTQKETLDAFYDLKVTIEGASPLCTVSLDNSKYSKEVRSAVTYTTDKSFYANGEVVTITAILSDQGKESFTLKNETITYEVSNMPEYYDVDTIADTDTIESELRDFVNAEIGQMTQTNTLFGIGGYSPNWHYTKVDSVTSSKGYLLTLKDTKKDQYGSVNAPFYNSIRIVADCHAHTGGSDGERQGHIYVCFALDDVVVHPDGHISWANKRYDITYTSKVDDSTIANEGVYRWAICYDTQEMEKTDWISIRSEN